MSKQPIMTAAVLCMIAATATPVQAEIIPTVTSPGYQFDSHCTGTWWYEFSDRTSTTSVSVLWGVYEKKTVKTHVDATISYDVECAAVFTTSVTGSGGYYREVGLETSHALSSSSSADAGEAILFPKRYVGTCTYTGVEPDTKCTVPYTAEPENLHYEVVFGTHSRPASALVCGKATGMSGFNDSQHVKDVTKATVDIDSLSACMTKTIFWSFVEPGDGPVVPRVCLDDAIDLWTKAVKTEVCLDGLPGKE